MAVKTITITEDAYTRLAAIKTSTESFSEVIKRVTGRSSLLELVGVLNKKEATALRNAVGEIRDEMEAHVSKTARSLR